MSEPSPESIRVLVVDDSSVMRRIVSQALANTPGIEVVGTAVHGANALLKIPELKPDVVTLDVEMPEMSGLEALDVIREKFPSVRVIMCSTLTERGARVTIDALLRGASDYVAKPTSGMPSADALQQLQTDLVAKVRLHVRPRKPAALPAAPAPPAPPWPPLPNRNALPPAPPFWPAPPDPPLPPLPHNQPPAPPACPAPAAPLAPLPNSGRPVKSFTGENAAKSCAAACNGDAFAASAAAYAPPAPVKACANSACHPAACALSA